MGKIEIDENIITEEPQQIISTEQKQEESKISVEQITSEERKKTESNASATTWPLWLKDVSYDVIKVNNMKLKQKRILKLTDTHIENIKNGDNCTKKHIYADVSYVYLQGTECLLIHYYNDHVFTYIVRLYFIMK